MPTGAEAAPRRSQASLLGPVDWQRLRRRAGDLALALMFFISALPNAVNYGSGIANIIWVVGAVLMGVFSLVRVAPSVVMTTPGALAATAGMVLAPTMMRPRNPSVGPVAMVGIALELIGVVLGQVARLYLGRSFGLLPANRGIVARGPFGVMRHPTYTGWFMLALGTVISYPTLRNSVVLVATIPFMIWRIVLEERLLGEDPEYRAYQTRVRYRLVPGLF